MVFRDCCHSKLSQLCCCASQNFINSRCSGCQWHENVGHLGTTSEPPSVLAQCSVGIYVNSQGKAHPQGVVLGGNQSMMPSCSHYLPSNKTAHPIKPVLSLLEDLTFCTSTVVDGSHQRRPPHTCSTRSLGLPPHLTAAKPQQRQQP